VDPLLLQPTPPAVVGLAQGRLVDQPVLLGELRPLADLALVELPQARGLAVHDQHARAMELVEHRQQRADPRRRVHLDPVADPAGQPDLLVEPASAAGEDRHGTGARAALGQLALDALRVAAQRAPRLAVERGVLRHRAQLVEQAGDPGGRRPQVPPVRIESQVRRHDREVAPVETGDAVDRLW
jgi:hypothetical protein